MTWEEMTSMAAEEGFAAAVVTDTKDIPFDPSFRPLCAENLCGKYGANYSCPPDCGTPDEMRARIYNERRVELAFEEHRFFDVRRWKIAEQTENEPIMGMRISKEGDGSFSYRAVMQEDRVFRDYMYLYPIPEAEVHKGAIEQNPGW